MKILQVNKYYWPWIGGVETVVKDLAEGLAADADFEMEVLACQPRRGMESSSEYVKGAKIWRAGIVGQALSMPVSLDFFRLYRKLSADADLIVLHHPFPLGFLAAWLFSRRTKNKSAKITVWYHSDIVRQKFFGALLRPLIKKILSRSSKIFVLGQELIRSSKILPTYENKCVAIPFGLDLDAIEKSGNQKLIEQIKAKYPGKIVLAVGRLVYYKGFDVLIRAMRGLDARLIIIGSGKMEKELRDLIAALKLQDKISIIPSVPEIYSYLKACDVFVMPSTAPAEAFGIVQLEAMACGKPVINTDLKNAVSKVSINEQTGLTVQPGNVQQLHEAIGQLLDDEHLSKTYGENGKSRVAEAFSKNVFLEKARHELVDAVRR